jgi:hypothetical protein
MGKSQSNKAKGATKKCVQDQPGSAMAGKKPQTLLEVLEAGGKAGPVKVTKMSVNSKISAKVGKTITDNFKGYDQYLTDELEVDGMTMRNRMIHDRANAAPGEVFGKIYYLKIKALYADPQAPAKRIVVIDKTEPISPALEKAVLKLFQHIPKYPAVIDYLSTVKTLNQRSCAFLLRSTLKVDPRRCQQARTTVISILQWFQKNGMHQKYPAEFGHVKNHFDLALAQGLAALKATGQSGKVWWESVKSVAPLVLPVAEFEILLALGVEASFDNYQAELSVVTGTHVGGLMYALAAAQMQSRAVSEWIRMEIAELSQLRLTEAVLQESRDRFCTFCEEREISAAEEIEEYAVEVVYRTRKVSFEVASPIQEYNNAIFGLVATVGVETGKVKKFLCEDALLPPGRFSAEGASIDDGLVDSIVQVRAAANELVMQAQTVEQNLSVAIQNVNDAHGTVLKGMCPGWVVEENFFRGMAGTKGEESFKQLITDCLRSEEQLDKSLESCMEALKKLRNTPVYKFVSIALQVKLSNVMTYLEALSRKRPPQFSENTDATWMQRVKDHLGLFCEHEVGGESQYGVGAAEAMVAALVQKAKGKEPVSFTDVTSVWPFVWLLDPNLAKQVTKYYDGALASPDVAMSSSSSSKVSETAPMKKKAKKSHAAEPMHDLLMSLSM